MRFSMLIGISIASVMAMTAQASDQRRDFEIPPQDLGSALEQLIEQTRIDLLYDSDAVRNKSTTGVSGYMTLEEAIESLLRDSGLGYAFTTPGTVAIQPRVGRSGSQAPSRLDEEGRFRMPGMTVTATRGAVNIKDAPAAVTVMTAEDLDLRHTLTLDQAVQATSGAFAKRSRSLMDTNSSLSFRGFPGQRRTLIMVDGLPLNDIYSADVSFPTIDLNTVERIEIARGPFSSLYGGNAMSGVVNVITRPIDASGANLSIGYGDAWNNGKAPGSLFDAALGARLRVSDVLGLSASYRYRTTDGYPNWYITRAFRSQGGVPFEPDIPANISGAIETTTNTGVPTTIIGDAGYNGYRDGTLTLKADYRFADGDALILSHTRSSNRYTYGERHSYLRDENGNFVFGFEPGETGSGATSTALAESAFLSGAPGGAEQDTWGLSWLHGREEITGKLVLGHVDLGRNWFVTANLRPRPGTESVYVPSTRDGGRGLLSQSEAQHTLADYQISLPLGRHHTVTTGLSWLHGRANNEEIALRNWRDTNTHGELRSEAHGKIQSAAVFVQDQWDMSPRFTAYLGLRHDWWQTRDGRAYSFSTVADGNGDFNDLDLSFPKRSVDQLSPKAALVYKHSPATTWRASAGKSFRGPSVFELYRTWFSSTTGTEFRSNPDLVPETSRSWEIGVDHGFDNGVRLAATWFDNRMKDFIYRLTILDISPVSTFQNAAKASSRGAEVSIDGHIGRMSWYANYTLTDAVIDEFPFATDPSVIEGKRIIQFPKHLANLGGAWRAGDFLLSGNIHYSEERYNTDANTDIVNGVFGAYDSPTLVDVKLSWQATDHVRLSLAIDNLFDREWYDFYRAPGRSWFAQASLDI